MRELRSKIRTALVGLAVVAVAGFAVACGGDGDDGDDAATATPGAATAVGTRPAATASPVATGTASAAPCPVRDEICERAGEIEAALRAGDFDAIIGDTPGEAVTCPANSQPLDGTYPLCDGATGGEVRYGFPIGTYQSEGGRVTIEGVREAMRIWRDGVVGRSGAEAITARTVGCAETDTACDEIYALVFAEDDSSGAAETEISLINLVFAEGDTGGELVNLLAGTPTLNAPLIEGGAHDVGILFGGAAGTSATYRALSE